MGRKNRHLRLDLSLPPIKEDRRSMPRCSRFPSKTVFTTGYRAQIAVDEIQSRSNRDKTPVRVYSCEIDEGGCGYFHITSQSEYNEDHNGSVADSAVDAVDSVEHHYVGSGSHDYLRNSGYGGAEF